MKLTDDYCLHKVCGQNILVPTTENELDFTNMLVLNETGATLWKSMSQGSFSVAGLVNVLTECYSGVDSQKAKADVEEFVEELRGMGTVREEE